MDNNPIITKEEEQKRKRINIALWAYAYEVHNDSIVSDAMFDKVGREIDLTIKTGNPEMDKWFEGNYEDYEADLERRKEKSKAT